MNGFERFLIDATTIVHHAGFWGILGNWSLGFKAVLYSCSLQNCLTGAQTSIANRDE